jgi:hypothetical protein
LRENSEEKIRVVSHLEIKGEEKKRKKKRDDFFKENSKLVLCNPPTPTHPKK